MELRHRFTLPASVEEAWTAFYFPNRIAPCLPGATLGRIDGADFDGLLKIKLGPTPVEYEGTATFLERSPENQRIIVQAKGRDRRGHGTIMATVSMTFTETESETEVESVSVIEFTGQASSLSESVVWEASDRLVRRLVECVSGKFADGLGDPPSAQELAMTTPAKPAARPREPADQRGSQVAAAPEAAAPDAEQGDAKVSAAQETLEPNSEQAESPIGTPDAAKSDAEPAKADAAAPDPVKPDSEPARAAKSMPTKTAAEGAPAPDSGASTIGTANSISPQPTTPADPVSQVLASSPEPGGVATVGLPLLRRYGPPLMGAVVVGSVISSILRRLRRE